MTRQGEKRPPKLEAIIRRATERELGKMVTDGTDEIDRWKPDALASWIAPGIIRSVKRHLTPPPSPRRRRT